MLNEESSNLVVARSTRAGGTLIFKQAARGGRPSTNEKGFFIATKKTTSFEAYGGKDFVLFLF